MLWSQWALNKRPSVRGHVDLELGLGLSRPGQGSQAGSRLGLVAEGMLKVGDQEEVVF